MTPRLVTGKQPAGDLARPRAAGWFLLRQATVPPGHVHRRTAFLKLEAIALQKKKKKKSSNNEKIKTEVPPDSVQYNKFLGEEDKGGPYIQTLPTNTTGGVRMREQSSAVGRMHGPPCISLHLLPLTQGPHCWSSGSNWLVFQFHIYLTLAPVTGDVSVGSIHSWGTVGYRGAPAAPAQLHCIRICLRSCIFLPMTSSP